MTSQITKSKFYIPFILISFLIIYFILFTRKSEEFYFIKSERKQTWALLVAGSKGWSNYRHQADVCHAYQVLHSHGVPDDNIVVMMYDDIANHEKNTFKGKLFNRPGGPDVYKGVNVGRLNCNCPS